ncbi:hypothetical protein [Winogradskyella flava]|uniref:Uncharacterized protein n=1 Tax=Winogradskyella flava TaxID=1884876 RepID=A0A842IXV8_9FLAO|nr:hypothetical protein [Winogradskyella flava]MBC2846536.1 hypothetical protein [Winogradskyella flava]
MKNLLNLGKALNKAEQKQVFGGGGARLTKDCGEQCECQTNSDCSGFGLPAGYEPIDCMQVGCGGTGNGYYQGSCVSGSCQY